MVNHILVGTSKGLVKFQWSNDNWVVQDVQFLGFPISMIYIDPRNDIWWLSATHRQWGSKLYRSDNHGVHWTEITTPSYTGEQEQTGRPASLKSIWTMHHAGEDNPDCLWMGTEPGGLFYSHNGFNFDLVTSLWNHPSRKDKRQWFGAGRNSPFIHSVVVDPRDSKHIYIAVSAAGVFETRDGGASWIAVNNGLISGFLPNPSAQVGHDPHILLQCQSQPEVLWQQTHCGIFRTEDGGTHWSDVTSDSGLPGYGFAMAIDHSDPKCAWVIPAQSDEKRVAPGLRLAVYETDSGGASWCSKSRGLPSENTFDIVLRQAFVICDSFMVFGTNNGNLYLSTDRARSWQCITQNLAKINVVQIVSG